MAEFQVKAATLHSFPKNIWDLHGWKECDNVFLKLKFRSKRSEEVT